MAAHICLAYETISLKKRYAVHEPVDFYFLSRFYI